MGGPFSAQAADLHSVWRLKQAVRCLRRLGDLDLSDSGMPVWAVRAPGGEVVRVTLAQFRDNVLVASSSREHGKLIMSKVCGALSAAWKLPVLCECGDTCTGACMLSSIIAVGVCVTLPLTKSTPLVHLHPSSLDKSWSLKGYPSLHSPELC